MGVGCTVCERDHRTDKQYEVPLDRIWNCPHEHWLLGRSSSSLQSLAWGLRLDYDCMCSEMDFTPEKSFSSNYKNS